MKLSVSSYSYSQYLGKGLLNHRQCVEKVKEMGFDYIEFIDGFFSGAENPLEFAKEVRTWCDELGLGVSCYSVGADFVNNGLEKEIERLKGQIDIAAVLGCGFMRHDITGGAAAPTYIGYENVLDTLVAGCKAVTEYAKTKAVVTVTENHGFFSQDSIYVEKLVNTVADDNFGLLVDMGNFLCADEDPDKAVGRCAKYARYVHTKDFVVKSGNGANPGRGYFTSRGGNFLKGTIVGHGNVPVVACLRALKNTGYNGFVSIEFEGMEDCIDAISISKENIERYLTQI